MLSIARQEISLGGIRSPASEDLVLDLWPQSMLMATYWSLGNFYQHCGGFNLG